MRKSAREKFQAAQRQDVAKQEFDLRALAKLMLGGEPNPTQWKFICDPGANLAYMGAVGVAKTSTICCAALLRALLQPGCQVGVFRRDYNDLKDTTLKSMERMLSRLPEGTLKDRSKSPPEKWWITCADGKSISEITFMGLSDSLGSYEFNLAIIDEAEQIEKARMDELAGRMRAKGGNWTTMLCFNPPDKTHWLYQACTGRDQKDRVICEPAFKLYTPVPGENAINLPPNYHEEAAKRMSADMQQRLIRGEWGVSFDGKPVYREFDIRMHGRRGLRQKFDLDKPLLRFWDFGYSHPACLFAQLDEEGRILIFKDYLGEDEEVPGFARRIQGMTRELFPTATQVLDFGDPAVAQRKDTGQTLELLARVNITMLYQNSRVEDGVQKIRLLLERLVKGEPALQIDTEQCDMTVRALRGGYRLDPSGQKPVKDGFYDHLMDALRYGVYNLIDTDGSLTPQAISSDIKPGFADARNMQNFWPDNWSYDPSQDPDNKEEISSWGMGVYR